MANKEDLKRTIQAAIDHCRRSVNEGKNALQEDILHHFAWNGEELYKNAYRIKVYETALSRIDDLGSYIRQLSDFLSFPGNVQEQSTRALHRECSMWRYEITLEVRNSLIAWNV